MRRKKLKKIKILGFFFEVKKQIWFKNAIRLVLRDFDGKSLGRIGQMATYTYITKKKCRRKIAMKIPGNLRRPLR